MNKINSRLLGSRAFVVFDAVVKKRSFSAAADYLHLGQPAVSHSIKQLERQLGCRLLQRGPAGITLTNTGEILAPKVDAALSLLREGISAVSDHIDRPANTVTLSVSTSLAQFWLLPRITKLKRRYPDLDLRCITNDSDKALSNADYDLSIPLGAGEWQGYHRWLFTNEMVFPVASPGYAKDLLADTPLHQQPRLDLIHLEEDYQPRLDWQHWFEALDNVSADLISTTRSNDYAIVLQAALEGQGIALGWQHIVAPLLARGDLLRLGERAINSSQPFYILAPAHRPLSKAVIAVRDWLMMEAGQSKL